MERNEQERLFAKSLETCGPMLHRIASTFAGKDDVEDLKQELLLSLWKSLPRFNHQSKLSTYLYKVGYNTALTWKRSHARRTIRDNANRELTKLTQANQATTDPRLVELYEAIRSLPRGDRTLVSLSLEGLSQSEIAEIVGIQESTVAVKISRIRKRLTRILTQQKQ